MQGDEVEGVADRRQRDEQQERTPTSVVIADPPPGILIDAIEQVLAGTKEADGGDGRAERFQVFGQESLPEVLAEREQEHRKGDGDDVALETERLLPDHAGSISLVSRREGSSDSPRLLTSS